MRKIVCILLAALLTMALGLASAEEAPESKFTFHVSTYHDNRANDMYHYRLYTPESVEGAAMDALGQTVTDNRQSSDEKTEAVTYPLVVYLHDTVGNGMDNKSQLTETPLFFASEAVQKTHPCYVLAPQMNSWWDGFGVGTVVQNVLDAHADIDPTRVYLVGEYMGGWGAYEAALHNLNTFAAVLVGAPEVQKQLEYEHKTFVLTDDTGAKDMCKKIVDTAFWILQPKDDARVPESINKPFYDTLSSYKRELDGQTYTIDANYTLLESSDAEAAIRNNEAGVLDWLFEQQRTLSIDILDFVDLDENGIMRTNHNVTYSPIS